MFVRRVATVQLDCHRAAHVGLGWLRMFGLCPQELLPALVVRMFGLKHKLEVCFNSASQGAAVTQSAVYCISILKPPLAKRFSIPYLL